MTSNSSQTTAVSTAASSVIDWVAALAQPTPNPGGGAAAGVMLGVAAALTSMVAGYTKPEGDLNTNALEALTTRAEALRADALDFADDDAKASEGFAVAFRLDEGAERDEAIRAASVGAAQSAAVLGNRAIGAVSDLEWLAEHGTPMLLADVAVASAALRAAVAAARTNVGVDLAALLPLGDDAASIRDAHPELWESIGVYDTAIARIDRLVASMDERIVPTHLA